MEIKDKIIVALDVKTLEEAGRLVKELAPHADCFKVGLQLLTSIGAPRIVEFIHGLGGKVFLDGKFNDIPNTAAEAAAAVSSLGVAMFSIHASAGIEAMKVAVRSKGGSLALAVTVLSSLDDGDSRLLFGVGVKSKVLQFALDAKRAGMDGIICSPRELELLGRQKELANMLKIVPGIRPKWAATNDQKRVMTPAEAIKAGATALVIGRPITKPPAEIGSPVEAVKRITEEIAEALAEGK